jgi:hypothetical protein
MKKHPSNLKITLDAFDDKAELVALNGAYRINAITIIKSINEKY